MSPVTRQTEQRKKDEEEEAKAAEEEEAKRTKWCDDSSCNGTCYYCLQKIFERMAKNERVFSETLTSTELGKLQFIASALASEKSAILHAALSSKKYHNNDFTDLLMKEQYEKKEKELLRVQKKVKVLEKRAERASKFSVGARRRSPRVAHQK